VRGGRFDGEGLGGDRFICDEIIEGADSGLSCVDRVKGSLIESVIALR
jgi:hypothetical protein